MRIHSSDKAFERYKQLTDAQDAASRDDGERRYAQLTKTYEQILQAKKLLSTEFTFNQFMTLRYKHSSGDSYDVYLNDVDFVLRKQEEDACKKMKRTKTHMSKAIMQKQQKMPDGCTREAEQGYVAEEDDSN